MFNNNSMNLVLTRMRSWIDAKTFAAIKFCRGVGTLKPLVVNGNTLKSIRQRVHLRQSQEIPANILLHSAERRMIDSIRAKTERMNRNNITRTQAYYHIYRACPELHWALLAHMVSRNSGWNMTDLRAEMLPRLLSPTQIEDVYQMLERANSLIFQDAYPQLLLYQESKLHGKNLFQFLEHFHVSRFMLPFWDYFWESESSNPIPLTIALIVNEQNYIEGRIVKNDHFKNRVLQSVFFRAQALMQLNQVLYPCLRPSPNKKEQVKLVGIILEDFTDLNERIEFGKKLYNLLFGSDQILKQIEAFAGSTKHTGSRGDYWPQLFAKYKKEPPRQPYRERLKAGRFIPGADLLFSPELEQVWQDRPVTSIERYDWFSGSEGWSHIRTIHPPFTYDMTAEHLHGLNRIELAVIAEQKL